MNSKTRFHIFLFSLIGIVLVSIAISNQLLLTFDSYQFLYGAQNLYENGKLIVNESKPYINRAPLFPIILAILKILTGNFLISAHYFHIICWGATIYILGITFYSLFEKKIFFWLYLSCITIGVPLLMTHIFLWSEPVFFLLLSSLLYFLFRYKKKYSIKSFLFLILISNLLCLQRYAGIFFSIGVAFYLLNHSSFKKGLIRSSLYFTSSIFGIGIWFIRNYTFYQLTSGQQKSHVFFNTPSNKVFYLYSDSIFSWFLPHTIPFILRGILLISLLFFLFFFWIKNSRSNYYVSESIKSQFYLFSCFFIGMFLFYSGIVDEVDRYLCSTYILLIGILFLLIDRYYNYIQILFIKKIILLSIVLWMIYPIVHASKNILFWNQMIRTKNQYGFR